MVHVMKNEKERMNHSRLFQRSLRLSLNRSTSHSSLTSSLTSNKSSSAGIPAVCPISPSLSPKSTISGMSNNNNNLAMPPPSLSSSYTGFSRSQTCSPHLQKEVLEKMNFPMLYDPDETIATATTTTETSGASSPTSNIQNTTGSQRSSTGHLSRRTANPKRDCQNARHQVVSPQEKESAPDQDDNVNKSGDDDAEMAMLPKFPYPPIWPASCRKESTLTTSSSLSAIKMRRSKLRSESMGSFHSSSSPSSPSSPKDNNKDENVKMDVTPTMTPGTLKRHTKSLKSILRSNGFVNNNNTASASSTSSTPSSCYQYNNNDASTIATFESDNKSTTTSSPVGHSCRVTFPPVPVTDSQDVNHPTTTSIDYSPKCFNNKDITTVHRKSEQTIMKHNISEKHHHPHSHHSTHSNNDSRHSTNHHHESESHKPPPPPHHHHHHHQNTHNNNNNNNNNNNKSHSHRSYKDHHHPEDKQSKVVKDTTTTSSNKDDDDDMIDIDDILKQTLQADAYVAVVDLPWTELIAPFRSGIYSGVVNKEIIPHGYGVWRYFKSSSGGGGGDDGEEEEEEVLSGSWYFGSYISNEWKETLAHKLASTESSTAVKKKGVAHNNDDGDDHAHHMHHHHHHPRMNHHQEVHPNTPLTTKSQKSIFRGNGFPPPPFRGERSNGSNHNHGFPPPPFRSAHNQESESNAKQSHTKIPNVHVDYSSKKSGEKIEHNTPAASTANATRATNDVTHYKLGESLQSYDDTLKQGSKENSSALRNIKQYEFAFIKRSDMSWTYAILADRRDVMHGVVVEGAEVNVMEEAMLFVIDNNGHTKTILKRHWDKYILCPKKGKEEKEVDEEVDKVMDAKVDVVLQEETFQYQHHHHHHADIKPTRSAIEDNDDSFLGHDDSFIGMDTHRPSHDDIERPSSLNLDFFGRDQSRLATSFAASSLGSEGSFKRTFESPTSSPLRLGEKDKSLSLSSSSHYAPPKSPRATRPKKLSRSPHNRKETKAFYTDESSIPSRDDLTYWA